MWIRTFIGALTIATALYAGEAACQQENVAAVRSGFDPVERAARHPIIAEGPAVDFFEGALLGNGGLGAVVTTRPDAVVIHFGHNDVWDIRFPGESSVPAGTFGDTYARAIALPPDTQPIIEGDSWSREYPDEHLDKPYPRPFPCGSIVLWFDRREAELLGHYMHINSGFCEVDFLIRDEIVHLQIFVDMTADRLWARTIDADGLSVIPPFQYISIIPDPTTPQEFPSPVSIRREDLGLVGFRQILPATAAGVGTDYVPDPRDRSFTLKTLVNGGFSTTENTPDERIFMRSIADIPGLTDGERNLTGIINPLNDFVLSVQLDSGPSETVTLSTDNMAVASMNEFQNAAGGTIAAWESYWQQSGVALGDDILERTWYQNMYFLRCVLRPGTTCPGMFGNWRYGDRGASPVGGYRMNFATQQLFWAVFSSNHQELHLPYVDMIERNLLPMGRAWARDYYGLNGAAFPHTAYPVEMSSPPSPQPPALSWQVCVTPWTAQSLWWHFMYTMDIEFLRSRAFPVMQEAAMFLSDYLKRPEAHDERWNDDRYHMFPSAVPGLYGLTPGLDHNADTLPDLAMTKFLFFAYLEACEILDYGDDNQSLISDIRDILLHFPDYPTVESEWGDVFASVAGEDPDTVYNIPVNLMTVFPGEEHGLHSPQEIYMRAGRTYLNHQNEGGNDLVFLNLIGARLGMLDLDKFIGQIEYCRLPNGTCTKKLLQVHGRYSNTTPFNVLADDGIWIENFGLPAVVNECLLQSYTGELRLFPNWTADVDAEFQSLRAAGAFLVNARISQGTVEWIEITSEAGAPLKIISPWPDGATIISGSRQTTTEDRRIEIETTPGEIITLLPRS